MYKALRTIADDDNWEYHGGGYEEIMEMLQGIAVEALETIERSDDELSELSV